MTTLGEFHPGLIVIIQIVNYRWPTAHICLEVRIVDDGCGEVLSWNKVYSKTLNVLITDISSRTFRDMSNFVRRFHWFSIPEKFRPIFLTQHPFKSGLSEALKTRWEPYKFVHDPTITKPWQFTPLPCQPSSTYCAFLAPFPNPIILAPSSFQLYFTQVQLM